MTSGALLLSVRDAAKALGIGRDATYQLVHSGELASIAIGRRLLVPRSALEQWIAGRTRAA